MYIYIELRTLIKKKFVLKNKYLLWNINVLLL